MRRRWGAMGRASMLLGASVSLWALGGCSADPARGYSFTSAHSENVRTVAVPIFKNTTYTKGIEANLAAAVISEMRRTTGWTVTSTDTADAILSGTITGSKMRPLSTGRQTGQVEQMVVSLTVDFDFKDTRTGESLMARRRFTGVGSFVPAIPAGERLKTGQNAAIDSLAQGIVAELRTQW